MVGVNSGDGRGNITAYATVFDSKQVLQRDRDYSACSLATGASDRVVRLRRLGDERRRPVHGLLDLLPDGGLRPTSCRDFDFGSDLYNFGPLNHYQRPERRYAIGAMGHYEFSENADVYTQLMFNDYESVAQIAPSGNFFETSVDQLRQPAAARWMRWPIDRLRRGRAIAADCRSVPMYIGRRNVEGGGRQQSFANSTFRVIGGRAWRDQRRPGATTSPPSTRAARGTAKTLNYFVTPRLASALDVVDVGGVPTCQSVDRRNRPNCVPWNPFAGRHHAGPARLPPGIRPPDRSHQPGDLQRLRLG